MSKQKPKDDPGRYSTMMKVVDDGTAVLIRMPLEQIETWHNGAKAVWKRDATGRPTSVVLYRAEEDGLQIQYDEGGDSTTCACRYRMAWQ
jgi:hypothetical protein